MLALLLLLGLGRAGTSIAPDGHLFHTLCALHRNYRTLDGERPALSPFDRVVVSLILSESTSCRPDMKKGRTAGEPHVLVPKPAV